MSRLLWNGCLSDQPLEESHSFTVFLHLSCISVPWTADSSLTGKLLRNAQQLLWELFSGVSFFVDSVKLAGDRGTGGLNTVCKQFK